MTLGQVVSEKFVFSLLAFSIMSPMNHKHLVLNINLNRRKSGQRLETLEQSNNLWDSGNRWAQQHSHLSQLSTIQYVLRFPFVMKTKYEEYVTVVCCQHAFTFILLFIYLCNHILRLFIYFLFIYLFFLYFFFYLFIYLFIHSFIFLYFLVYLFIHYFLYFIFIYLFTHLFNFSLLFRLFIYSLIYLFFFTF